MNVLNAGYINVLGAYGGDDAVARAAAICYDSGRTNDAALLRHLIRNGHGSPFEHAIFSFEVRCPIFVARQWMRHRIASYNERSLRYTKADPDFYLPEELAKEERETLKASYELSYDTYLKLLQAGSKRELARAVLPVGLYTEFIWTVNLRSFMNWLELRTAKEAQPEHRAYAQAAERYYLDYFPLCFAAWAEFRKAP